MKKILIIAQERDLDILLQLSAFAALASAISRAQEALCKFSVDRMLTTKTTEDFCASLPAKRKPSWKRTKYFGKG